MNCFEPKTCYQLQKYKLQEASLRYLSKAVIRNKFGNNTDLRIIAIKTEETQNEKFRAKQNNFNSITFGHLNGIILIAI